MHRIKDREAGLPLDVAYILGLSGPSQGTSRTDHPDNAIIKDTAGNSCAEFSNIIITVTELTDPRGTTNYYVAVEMDVKSLGCSTPPGGGIGGQTPGGVSSDFGSFLAVEFRNVTRGIIIDHRFHISITCVPPWSQYHFSQSQSIPAAGWLQDWASTTVRVDGGFSPCP